MSFADIIALDARLSERLRVAEQPGLLRTTAAFLAHSGDSWFWLIALPILWFFGDASWKFRAMVMVAAILAMAAIVLALKFTIRRKRPEGEWGQIYRKTDPHSFPSGHAARGILLGILGLGLGPTWFGLLLIVWGPLVGLARIAMGVHFLSDVVAGWVLGIVMGLVTLQVVPQFLL